MKNNAQRSENGSGLKTLSLVIGIIVGITAILAWLGIGPFSHSKPQPTQSATTSGNNSPAVTVNGNISGNANFGGNQTINPPLPTTGEKLVNWTEGWAPGSAKGLVDQMKAGNYTFSLRLPIALFNRLQQIAAEDEKGRVKVIMPKEVMIVAAPDGQVQYCQLQLDPSLLDEISAKVK